MADKIKRIGVMTSGGDSPGMNAAIRAVVRSALHYDLEVYGIRHAYAGLINGEIEEMDSRRVSGIIQQGGTILQTARLPEFREDSYQMRAVRTLREHGIGGLVVIGGDGSLTGALALSKRGVKVVGIPASIDNDIWGTASSIGVDTALNTIIDAIDRLRDTASSHERLFLVETMGRNCGYLSIVAGLITGAELVLVPEEDMSLAEIGEAMTEAYLHGKSHALAIVAEGAKVKVNELADFLQTSTIGFEVRTTILGHVQRGGRPTAFDRTLATRMGVAAVEEIVQGNTGVMMALEGTKIVPLALEEVIGKHRPLNPSYLHLSKVLSR